MDTKLLDEYSKQVNEYLKQVREWQQKFLDTCMESFPGSKNQSNLSDNWKKAINLQQDWVNSAVEAEEVTMRMTMATQKDFWNGYFDLIRKMPFVETDTPVSKS